MSTIGMCLPIANLLKVLAYAILAPIPSESLRYVPLCPLCLHKFRKVGTRTSVRAKKTFLATPTVRDTHPTMCQTGC
jgi:hypothetical protein